MIIKKNRKINNLNQIKIILKKIHFLFQTNKIFLKKNQNKIFVINN